MEEHALIKAETNLIVWIILINYFNERKLKKGRPFLMSTFHIPLNCTRYR